MQLRNKSCDFSEIHGATTYLHPFDFHPPVPVYESKIDAFKGDIPFRISVKAKMSYDKLS